MLLPRVNVVLPDDDAPAPTPVPTSEFYELNMDEARDLNEDGEGDPILGEFYERNRGPGDEGATFRIRTYAADRTTPIYQYYVASGLWEWARRGNRTDPRRNPWRYSDWMDLRNQFDPIFPIPNWVRDLENADLRAVRENGSVLFYDDRHGAPRLVRKEMADGRTVHYGWQAMYGGGVYYRTSVKYGERSSNPNWRNSTMFYAWDAPELPHGVFQNQVNLNESAYSKFVRHEKPGQWTRFYSGPSGGGERLNRVYWVKTGETWTYGHDADTNRGDEYLTERTFDPVSPAAGQKWFYDGDERGKERLDKVIHPNGQIDIYAGEAGTERKVMSQFRDNSGGTGQMVSLEFVGPKGREKVKSIRAWSQYHTLTGSQTVDSADDEDSDFEE